MAAAPAPAADLGVGAEVLAHSWRSTRPGRISWTREDVEPVILQYRSVFSTT